MEEDQVRGIPVGKGCLILVHDTFDSSVSHALNNLDYKLVPGLNGKRAFIDYIKRTEG